MSCDALECCDELIEIPMYGYKNSPQCGRGQRRPSSLRHCANGRAVSPTCQAHRSCLKPPRRTRGLAARLLRDWASAFEFVSRIYLYSALIGLIAGLGAVLFTYGPSNWPSSLLVEKLAGYRQDSSPQ